MRSATVASGTSAVPRAGSKSASSSRWAVSIAIAAAKIVWSRRSVLPGRAPSSVDVMEEVSTSVERATRGLPRGREVRLALQRGDVGGAEGAGDEEGGGGGVRLFGRGQEQHGVGEFHGVGEPAHRHVDEAPRRLLGVVRVELLEQRRVDG